MAKIGSWGMRSWPSCLQRSGRLTVTDCNCLSQNTAYCNRLPDTATDCYRLPLISTYWYWSAQTATKCHRLPLTTTDCHWLAHTANNYQRLPLITTGCQKEPEWAEQRARERQSEPDSKPERLASHLKHASILFRCKTVRYNSVLSQNVKIRYFL